MGVSNTAVESFKGRLDKRFDELLQIFDWKPQRICDPRLIHSEPFSNSTQHETTQSFSWTQHLVPNDSELNSKKTNDSNVMKKRENNNAYRNAP